MAVVAAPPQSPTRREVPEPSGRRRGVGPFAWVGAVLVAWVVLWFFLRDRQTLPLSPSDLTPLHLKINEWRDWVDDNRNSSPIFLYFFNIIRLVLDNLAQFFRETIAIPPDGSPIQAAHDRLGV